MAMEMIKKDMEKKGYLGKDKVKREEANNGKRESNVASMLKTSKGRGKGVA
jgi:hypothetical protein